MQAIRKGYLRIIAVAASVTLVFRHITRTIFDSIEYFRQYEKALTEVNTLYSGAGGLTESTKKFVEAQALTYGSSQIQNLKAYYQIVSAGITDQTKANQVLEQSNRAAIAGVTDLFTAADGLTSVLNAYKGTSVDAAKATNILFKTVKIGKTTFPELAGSLGQVLPTARAAGLTLEEVNATVAALTLNGLSTSEAITQLKGVLISLIKPSEEGEEALEKLGITWDTATVKSQGFTKTMLDLIKVTGGNEKIIGKVIRRARGLGAALAIANDGGEKLVFSLKEIQKEGDASGEAFKKMSDTLDLAIKKNIQEMGKYKKQIGLDLKGIKLSLQEYQIAYYRTFANIANFTNKHKSTIWKTVKSIFKAYILGSRSLWRPPERGLTGMNLFGGKKIEDEQKKAEEKAKAAGGTTEQGKAILSKASKIALNLEMEEAKKSLHKIYNETTNVVLEGIRKVKEETIKAIQLIREKFFGGGAFASLGEARKILKENPKARRTFDSFLKKTGQSSHTPEGMTALAKSSVAFQEFDFQGRQTVESIIRKMKELKGEVKTTDITGIIKSVQEGFKFDMIGRQLFKDIQEGFLRNRENILGEEDKKIQLLLEKGISKLGDDLTKAVEGFKEGNKLFKESVKEQTEALKRAFESDLASRIKGANLGSGMGGGLGIMDEESVSRNIQNDTSSLSRVSVKGN